jgi:predicted HTH transcriptional regulator
MSDWNSRAINLLAKSLKPVPSELNEIDWKSGLSDNTNRLAQHISAFSNTPGGGFLAYGVNNNGKFSPLTSVDIDEVIKKLGNISRNNLNPPAGIEHSILEFEGTDILFIYIPEQSEKPVHLRSGNIFDSYKRSAGQTVKMSQVEVKTCLALTQGFSFEEQIAIQNQNEDDVLNLLEYDNYFRLINRNLPDGKKGILEVLANEDMIIKNDSSWAIKNLGAVLFARNLSAFKNLKRKAIRVIIYKGKSRVDAIKEQEGTRGYATAFEGLVKYIMDQLPTNEVIEKALRQQVKIYPEKAIREFVANALIHQDFSITGTGVMIEIFSDRIEITNPGIPLVDTNRFIDTAPKSRNESLASLMRRLNICEERGSGIDRAVEAIELYQLPAPKFLKGEDYTRVIMYALVPLGEMDKEDRIRACYQHTCLHYVSNQVVNNQSIRKRFNISKNNVSYASKILTEAMESGLIKPSDPENASKKYATYIPFWA